MSRRLGHRPPLDGVRAIAILAVMGVHAIGEAFRGGWLGVDVFFVLSAFLITSLIIEEFDERRGKFSYRSFYWRRAFRLGPALLLWLAIVAPITAIAAHDAHVIPISTAASLFYVSDFVAAAGVDLGGAYIHGWSLAVEEQFYAVWPVLLVAVLLTKTGLTQRWIFYAAVPAAVATAELSYRSITQNYFLPTGHLVPLAVGCVAGYLFMRSGDDDQLLRVTRRRIVGPTCLVLMILVICFYRQAGPEIVLLQIVVLALSTGALLLHVCLRSDSLTAKALSIRPALWLGRRSYALYLYHASLFVLVPTLIPGLQFRFYGPLVLAISFVLAELSFRVVERPVSRGGRAWLRRQDYAGIVHRAESDLPISPPDHDEEVVAAAQTPPLASSPRDSLDGVETSSPVLEEELPPRTPAAHQSK